MKPPHPHITIYHIFCVVLWYLSGERFDMSVTITCVWKEGSVERATGNDYWLGGLLGR